MRVSLNPPACLLLVITLAACGDKTTTSEPSTPSPQALAEQRIEAEFKQTPPFTLNCRGNYSHSFEGKTNSGTQSFGISVSPGTGEAYMFGFEADGFLDRTHRDMNNEVRRISSVTEEEVSIGQLKLNRKTAKYTYSSVTAGLCNIAPQHVPIPKQKF